MCIRDSVTYGAVIIDPEDGMVESFGARMTEPMRRMLSENGTKKQIIGQAELLPMVVSRILWSGKLAGRDVIHYVDNEAARMSAIKGSSPSRSSAWLVQAFWETEVTNETKSWISRVPTECNIGDGPSREDWSEVEEVYPNHKKILDGNPGVGIDGKMEKDSEPQVASCVVFYQKELGK